MALKKPREAERKKYFMNRQPNSSTSDPLPITDQGLLLPDMQLKKDMQMINDIQQNSELSAGGSSKPTVVGSTVILGDCVEVMKEFADNQFDLAIVDPEYGIGRAGQTETFTKNPKHKRKHFEDKKWDSKPPGPEYWGQLFRVSKNQIIWGANYFTNYLPPSMGWIFWDKGQDLSMSDGELAYTSFQRALRRVKINRGQLMVEGGTIHPTQKPVKLYKWILKNYATEGMSILDTHLGSGSNRIACDNMGFDFTGIEIDKEYFDLSEKRFKQYKSQLRIEGW